MIILDLRFNQNDRTVSIGYIHNGEEGVCTMSLDFMKQMEILNMDNLTATLEDWEEIRQKMRRDNNGEKDK